MPFTAGQKLRASELNKVTEPPLFSAVQTVAQSIPNNTWTSITFTTETLDTVSGHSTLSNTSRYTAQAGWAGYYQVSGLVYFATGATGVRVTRLTRSGVAVPGSVTRHQATDDGFGNGEVSLTQIVLLAVGDYIEIQGLHTQGAAVNTFVSSGEASALHVLFLRAG